MLPQKNPTFALVMKRAVSIVLMFLASITILAHGIVPHHHHDQLPVALVHLYDGAVDAHSDAPGHAHHHGVPDEDCLINDALGGAILRMQDGDYSQEERESLSDPFFPAILTIPLPSAKSETDAGLPFRRRPYILNHYIDAVVRASGLRAPPVC